MALQRMDAYRKFEVDGAITRALVYYVGDYSGRSANWEVEVLAEDLPESPTDEQVCAAADADATALYDAWVDIIDAETVVETEVSGVAAVVVE